VRFDGAGGAGLRPAASLGGAWPRGVCELDGNLVVLGVALLVWGLLFLYLLRLERRIRDLEKR
jgi:hypothetical protein